MKDTAISPKVRAKVLARDSIDWTPCCIWCGRPFILGYGAHLHHVKHRSQGGRGTEDNLVTLCFECHEKLHRGDKQIDEYCKYYLREIYGNDTL